jgi:hypothetical protein
MKNFHPDHLADLRKSGLSEDTIIQAAIKSVRPDQINKRLGFNVPGLTSAYEIPYPGCDGFSRYRCFYAEGKTGHKYLQRKETGNHLYVPPQITPVLRDAAITLYIVEGEKKCLKAIQEGLNCIALPGLWAWANGEGGLIDDFNKIELRNREIIVVPDNDWLDQRSHGYGK